MSDLQASCLCGAVTLDVGEPQMFVECHCDRCRQWTGGASVAVVVTGEVGAEDGAPLKRYAEEGYTPRYFCGECGSSLYSGKDGTFYVTAGVLKDPPKDLACHVQVSEKAPWHEIGGEAPQHAGLPGG